MTYDLCIELKIERYCRYSTKTI